MVSRPWNDPEIARLGADRVAPVAAPWIAAVAAPWIAPLAAPADRLFPVVPRKRNDLAAQDGVASVERPRNRPAGGGPVSAADRIDVRKTYKLYIGGAFPRSESGRSYLVERRQWRPARERLPGLAQGPPRGRPGGPQGVPAMGRPDGDEPRPGSLPRRRAHGGPARPVRGRGRGRRGPPRRQGRASVVDRAIDRWVWYAGWADKIAQVLGSSNPVAAPYFNFTIPEPTGVVGIVAPETSSLLGLVSRVAPALVAGNAVVVLDLRDPAPSGDHPQRGPRHVRRARRRRQRPDRAEEGAGAGARRPRRRRYDRRVGRPGGPPDGDGAPRRRQHQADRAPPGRASATPASTGSTTAPPSGRSGSPPTSR